MSARDNKIPRWRLAFVCANLVMLHCKHGKQMLHDTLVASVYITCILYIVVTYMECSRSVLVTDYDLF